MSEWGTILGLVINAIVGVFVALLRGAMRRVADDLDRRLAAQDGRISSHDARLAQIADTVAAEREARHAELTVASDRLWQVNADLKENYPSRRESMKQFGTLVQQIQETRNELGEKIDALPCHAVACPGQKSGDPE